ncbi:hypothetical protein LXL04_028645 [Taraxacum kok-saghyz]
MMAVVPTSLMQRYENYLLLDKLYSIKHFKLSWNPFGCPKFEGCTFLYDNYSIDVSETTRFTLLEENNFPFYPLGHTIETLVRIPRRRLLIDVVGKVAGIWVEGNENITTYKRSIVVYGRSDYSTQIQPYEGCYDPLSYLLFFPNGEYGWHSRIMRNSVSINQIVFDEENMEEDVEGSNSKKWNTVSMREYYCYKFQMRSSPNMILLGGRLLQQFVVDMYIKIETSRLLYYRLNQKKIRSELYQGIVDCVNAGDVEPSKVGQRVVLAASFIGGPRDMRRRFLDTMTLVQDDGKPDIFLTIMCNPKLLMMFNCHLNVERDKSSMLTAFFKMNKVDGVARKYLYKEFPTYFTWNPSKRFNNELYPTFRKAAVERGLVETDDNLSQCLTEASLFRFPAALRRLFATILIYCEPGDVRKLWDEHYNSLSEDYSRQCESYERVKTMVLVDIGVFLQSMDEHVRAKDSLNSDQKVAYDEIMRHVDCNLSVVFFIDGPGGTGKTFLYKALLADVRSRGLIALATASSGAAANNMPGGRTTYSRFKIPINLDDNSMCNIKQQSGVSQLLRLAKIIICDESSMAHRQAVEAVDRSIQDITKLNLLFGGKIMILGGDFRQVLPVVRRDTQAQIVDSSLRMSPLWSSIKKLSLTINMRALADPWFSEFLMRVGDGEEGASDGTFIRIPDDMFIPYTDKGKLKDDLIDAIFPSLQINGGSSDYIISRAILSTKNEHVDEINDQLIDRFIGEQRVYYSFDEAEDDKNNFYLMEFLNSLNVSGLPPHYLRLKIRCPIILLRNIDPSN